MDKPLGPKSTAEQALRGVDLTGKTAIVTGGNSGIGAETCRVLAGAGARVVMTSRSVESGNKVAEAIKDKGVKGDVIVKQLDLADLKSIDAFTKDFLANEARLDLLVLNAGVMACPKAYTKDGFEMQIGTNHFGHFALTQRLLPRMSSQGSPARIVSLSSLMHDKGTIALDDLHWKKRKYNQWASYAQSKLANVLFAKELASRLPEGTQVTAFSVHPGIIATPLSRHMGVTGTIFRAIGGLFVKMKSVPQGAATTVYAATAPELLSQSGSYLADCAVKEPSKEGRDLDMASKLWEATEEQLKAAGCSWHHTATSALGLNGPQKHSAAELLSAGLFPATA
ncbi:hypothetical protein WJX72_009656 [[Myrmecia] bisecta]|uniref:Uncharacterized protein n=1 Tax=[Myrmecia] bisecta TaxID=41462 RepID=A0AAW1PAZ6_9CHLO